MRTLVLVLGVVALLGCGKKQAAAPAQRAGEVTAVSGTVTASRAGAAARPLAVGDDVWLDDRISTGPGARVELQLTSGATYELGPEQVRAVGEVVAQLRNMGGGAAGQGGDVTAAAGRHAEESSAETGATVAAPGGGAPAPPEPDDQTSGGVGTRQTLEEGKMGQAGSGSGSGGGGGSGADLFGGLQPGDIDDDVKGLGGVGIKGTGTGNTGWGDGNRNRTSGAHAVIAIDAATLEVSEGLAAETVRRYLRRVQNRFLYCLEKEMVVSPKVGGDVVTFTMMIDSTGKVVSASAKAKLLPAVITSCDESVLKNMLLPKPTGGQLVKVTGQLKYSVRVAVRTP